MTVSGKSAMAETADLIFEILDSYIPSSHRPSAWPDVTDDGLAGIRNATCVQLISNLLQPGRTTVFQDLIANDAADDLLLPRLARDTVQVVVRSMQLAMAPQKVRSGQGQFVPFCISKMAAMHLGSLASSPGCMTPYEVLRSLGAECSLAADALQALAQQRLFASCQCIQFDHLTDQVEVFLRSGAQFLCVDKSGRVAAHMAAMSGNPSLGHVIRAAPVALLIEDQHGQTPLELLWGQLLDDGETLSDLSAKVDDDLIEALSEAALICLASFPEQTAGTLQRSRTALEVWTKIAESGGHTALLAASAANANQTLSKDLEDAQDNEDSLVRQLQHRKKRILLLEALAKDHRLSLSDLEPKELKLALAKARHELDEQQKVFTCRLEELEQQISHLRNSLMQRDEEILELKSSRARQHISNSVVCALGDAPANRTCADTAATSVLVDGSKIQEPRLSNVSREENVISEIRNSRHLGAEPLELPEHLRQGIVEMRASLAAAVGRLAHDLYESKAHFLQELLQNADDNKYEKDVIPMVRFVLQVSSTDGFEKSFFYATNNESGMTEQDVRSLCDISRSSKTGPNEEVTGCKGVGWKSVFRVSDEPHVLCQGWRFKFSSQGLGMITPKWVDDKEYEALPHEVRAAHMEGFTVFYLPLADHQHVASIQSEMNFMKADIVQLLFLRRVREMHLQCGPKSDRVCISLAEQSASTACTVAVRHEPVGHEAQDTNDARNCSPEAPTEVCFEVCQHGDVSLAFPLTRELASQRIFAVLPVRPAGFKFAINAPFDLTASRTTLHHSPTNALRRDAVVAAFLQCCQSNSEIASRALEYLGSVPSDSFWLPVRVKILAGLQVVPCVLTEVGMVEPRACLLRGDLAGAKWVPDSLLWSACGLRFMSDASPPETGHDLGVSTFGYTELVACLNKAVDQNLIQDMWKHPSRSAIFSDVYSSLFQCLQEDPDRLPEVAALHIFPITDGAVPHESEIFVSASDAGAKLCASLCDQFPVAWQLPLVKCVSDKLDITGQASELLEVLGIEPLSEEETSRLALSALLHVDCQCPNLPMVWAALAIIQRCFHSEKNLPRPLLDIQDALMLPSAQGGLRPAGSLRLSSFLGIREVLPRSVIENVFEIGGFCSPLRVDLDYVALPPSAVLVEGSNYLEWEVFFWALGCKPADPTGLLAESFVEATLQLGDLLASGRFWAAASQSSMTLNYLDALIGNGSSLSRQVWLQQLPVRLGEHLMRLEDLFLYDVFHPLAGSHLHYLEGAPRSPRILAFLRRLGVATWITRSTLLKCLRCLRRRDVQDIGLVSDIYRELSRHDCGDLDEPLIMVPGIGYVAPDKCSWRPFELTFLRDFCRIVPISEHYLRFGQDVCELLQSWVEDSPETDAVELCDTLLSAVTACAKSERQSSEMFDKLFEGARAIVGALAMLCFEEPYCPDSDVAVECFRRQRIIVIPSTEPRKNIHCRLLLPREAFWSVCEELKGSSMAAYALDQHYGPNVPIQLFFCRVLAVTPELTVETLAEKIRPSQLVGAFGIQPQGQAKFALGFDVQDLTLFRNFSQTKPSNTTFDPRQAVHAALVAARRYTLPGQGAAGGDVGDRLNRQASMGNTRDANTANAVAPSAANSSASSDPGWQLVGSFGGLPMYVTREVFFQSAHLLPYPMLSQFNMPDTELICRLGALFGLDPTQIAFAFDPSGRSVCCEHLFLDISRIPIQGGWRLPGGNITSITFWLMELALAVAHQGVGPDINEHLTHVQTGLVSMMMPAALQGLQMEGWGYH